MATELNGNGNGVVNKTWGTHSKSSGEVAGTLAALSSIARVKT